MEKLSFEDFVRKIKEVDYAVGIKGQTYSRISCDDKWYCGVRESSHAMFKIDLQKLYDGYLKCTVINTSTLKKYVDRVQSPSYAILMAAGLI